MLLPLLTAAALAADPAAPDLTVDGEPWVKPTAEPEPEPETPPEPVADPGPCMGGVCVGEVAIALKPEEHTEIDGRTWLRQVTTCEGIVTQVILQHGALWSVNPLPEGFSRLPHIAVHEVTANPADQEETAKGLADYFMGKMAPFRAEGWACDNTGTDKAALRLQQACTDGEEVAGYVLRMKEDDMSISLNLIVSMGRTGLPECEEVK